MHTVPHWITAPLPGKLAIAARPRGGDWLEDELRAWKNAGVTEIVSRLTPDEEASLTLEAEAGLSHAQSLAFRNLAIEDRSVPSSDSATANFIDLISRDLSRGENVVVHCRQGIGRAGMISAAILIHSGLDAAHAIERASGARGVAVPETAQQLDWIHRFARTLHEAVRT